VRRSGVSAAANLAPAVGGGTPTTATLSGGRARENEEVVPVNVSMWVLLLKVTVGR
jgi:hypothetical protein